MARYTEAHVIVNGVDDGSVTFTGERELQRWLNDEITAAEKHGQHTEIYLLVHEHQEDVEECSCAQYVQDHHPNYVIN